MISWFSLKGDLLLEVEKYKELFQLSEKLHSTLNVDALLGELFVTLKEVYPNCSYHLLLSQDTYNHSDLPIIDLEYDSENMTVINAYESGEIQFGSSDVTKHAALYAPLKGNSGIYGVIQIIAPEVTEFLAGEVEFIRLLSKSAGNALENAKLYQQSQRAISDLELITRWGGEELAIYLPRVSLESGVAISKRILNKVSERSEPHITVSCGVSFWKKDHQDTYQNLFKRADEALYRAKETGKNKVVIEGNPSMVS